MLCCKPALGKEECGDGKLGDLSKGEIALYSAKRYERDDQIHHMPSLLTKEYRSNLLPPVVVSTSLLLRRSIAVERSLITFSVARVRVDLPSAFQKAYLGVHNSVPAETAGLLYPL